MKKCLALLFLIASTSSFAFSSEQATPDNGASRRVELAGGKILVQYPFLRILLREARPDLVYYGKNYSGRKICRNLGLGEYEEESKRIVNVRAVSTSNLIRNAIGYAISPINRLSEEYQYPKAKIVKEIVCMSRP